MKSMTEETFDQVYNFLMKKVSPEAAKGFKKAPNKAEWINKYWDKLNEDSDWVETYKSKEDIFGNPSKTFPSLWEQYEGKILTDAQFDVLKKKYPWIRREELNDWFNKTNEYKDFYNEEAKKQAGINRRTKEVRDEWKLTGDNPLAGLLASDYERQRYIKEPEAALFGKDSPELGEAPETRWGSMGDLGSGVVAGATDLATAPLPLVNAFAGPTVRLGRDVAHKVTGSPYQKDLGDIGSNYLSDIMINGGASVLANARRASRVFGGLLPGSTNKQFQALVDAKESAEALKKLPPTSNTWDFVNAVDNLEESSLKQDLLKTISPNGKVDVATANAVRKNYDTALDKEYFNELRTHTPGYYETATATNTAEQLRNAILKDAGNTSLAQRLGRAGAPKTIIERTSLGGLNLLDKLNKGTLGTRGVEAMANFTGRGSKPNLVQTALERQEQEDTIERIKNNYSLLWTPNNKPQGYDNPLIKEAYDRWMAENGYIPGVK
jgi:hypothetical protein